MDSKVLHKISYGMYIIASRMDARHNAQIANAVVQIASEPATIAISINKQNLTHQYIATSRVFTVSVLGKETPLSFIGQFGFKSGRDTDKFSGVRSRTGRTGAPIVLDNAIGFLEAEVVGQLDCNTHTIFLGRIVEAEMLFSGEPMTYAYYHEVKRGSSPKTAPTYIKPEAEREIHKVVKYQCKVCGYIYDPEKGDPDSGIVAGTPFEKLPDNWVCPVCGAAKSDFEKIS